MYQQVYFEDIVILTTNNKTSNIPFKSSAKRHDGQHSKEVTAVTSLGSESILSNQEIKHVYDDIEIKGISRKN